jgi:chromosome segregation ATPase
MKERAVFYCVISLLVFVASLVQGQESSRDNSSFNVQEKQEIKKTPLGVRQQRIKRMIVELEIQFSELARTLQKDHPEQAEKLVDAFKSSKEMLLEKRMDEITELLDLSKLDSAGEEQKKTIDDVKSLIEFLLKEDNESDRIKEEIKKLQEWKDAIDDLIKDENNLKEESEIHSDKDKALEDLDKQIGQLKELIKRQEELKADTEKESAKGIDGLDKIAEKQQELRKLTENLRNQIKGNEGDESKDNEPKEGEQNLNQDNSPGIEPLRDAEGDQKWAEKQLEKGKGKQAAAAEKEALDNLNKALEQLEKEKNRIAELGADDLEKLAKEQDSTANETGKL